MKFRMTEWYDDIMAVGLDKTNKTKVSHFLFFLLLLYAKEHQREALTFHIDVLSLFKQRKISDRRLIKVVGYQ